MEEDKPSDMEGQEVEEGEIAEYSDLEDNGAGDPAEKVSADEAEDYELNVRPTSWTAAIRDQQQSARSRGINSFQPSRPERPEPYTNRYENDGDEEDDRDSAPSSSEDSGSDDERLYGKKKRMLHPNKPGYYSSLRGSRMTLKWKGNNPFGPSDSSKPGCDLDNAMVQSSSSTATPTATSDGNDAFRQQASIFQQKRKPNNIWSKVLQDEEVSDIFGKVQVEEFGGRDILIDRGPESFAIKYKERIQTRTRRYSDSSDLSSEALTDNELEFLRGPADLRLKLNAAAAAATAAAAEGDQLPENFGPKSRKRTRDRTSNKPAKRKRKKLKNKMVNRLKKMNPESLGKYMAGKLDEPKTILLVNAIHIIGKEPIINLFFKTMKIERRGGLLIKNQERRRTAGGVFLYLLRGDRRIPKNLVSLVFNEERKFTDKSRKNLKSQQRLKRKARLEETKSAFEAKESKMEEGDKEEGESDFEDEPKNSKDEEEEHDSEDVDSDDYFGLVVDEEEDKDLTLPPRVPITYSEDDQEDYVQFYCDPTDIIP